MLAQCVEFNNAEGKYSSSNGCVDKIVPALSDKNGVVRCTAAAAVIRLTAIAERNRNKDVKVTKMALEGESKSGQTHSEAPVTGEVHRNGFGETATNQTR